MVENIGKKLQNITHIPSFLYLSLIESRNSPRAACIDRTPAERRVPEPFGFRDSFLEAGLSAEPTDGDSAKAQRLWVRACRGSRTVVSRRKAKNGVREEFGAARPRLAKEPEDAYNKSIMG